MQNKPENNQIIAMENGLAMSSGITVGSSMGNHKTIWGKMIPEESSKLLRKRLQQTNLIKEYQERVAQLSKNPTTAKDE